MALRARPTPWNFVRCYGVLGILFGATDFSYFRNRFRHAKSPAQVGHLGSMSSAPHARVDEATHVADVWWKFSKKCRFLIFSDLLSLKAGPSTHGSLAI